MNGPQPAAQFLGFAVDGYDVDEKTPVSHGATRDEAEASAIRRVLSLGIVDGLIQVIPQPQLSAEDFAAIGAHLDQWFAKKGIE